MAKKIKTKLIMFTKSGYRCLAGIYESKSEAKTIAKEMIEDGFAFSYQLSPVK